jgi:hypothetical protein
VLNGASVPLHGDDRNSGNGSGGVVVIIVGVVNIHSLDERGYTW